MYFYSSDKKFVRLVIFNDHNFKYIYTVKVQIRLVKFFQVASITAIVHLGWSALGTISVVPLVLLY